MTAAKEGHIHFPPLCFFLLCFLLTVPTFLQAAEWYIQPFLGARIDYDDNRLLRVTDQEAALSYRISPEFLFGVRTPSLDTLGTARVDVIRTTNKELQEALDAENIYSRFLSTYETARN